MPEDLQFMGFSTETTTPNQIHCSSFAHHKITEILDFLLDRPMFGNGLVQRIELTPKYAKKSTRASDKSERSAVQGPKITISGNQESSNPTASTIITEQGIRINFGKAGTMRVARAPFL